jgi:hypothetical protein
LQLSASVPSLLLGRDVHAMQTKAGRERAVMGITGLVTTVTSGERERTLH